MVLGFFGVLSEKDVREDHFAHPLRCCVFLHLHHLLPQPRPTNSTTVLFGRRLSADYSINLLERLVYSSFIVYCCPTVVHISIAHALWAQGYCKLFNPDLAQRRLGRSDSC